ncbi:MAG: hypothetical protein KatS3mg099_015 [Candidatus Parcubacteria bacterium]|nr:MAG: hypothetical protein KatS3mg099_015 [Candidatus Parcubacteria bacterium]
MVRFRRIRRSDWFADPFAALEEMRSLVEEALAGTGGGEEATTSFVLPPLDLSETDSHLIVRVEAPGVDPKALKVEATEDTLTVAGEIKNEAEEKGEQFYRIERQYGSFERTVSLPVPVDPESVEASYKDGVLMVRMAKKQQAGRKKVEVKLD